MNPCQDFELAISLRSTGALDRAEADALDLHLAGCEACRAEAARASEVLALAKLPPVDERERRALRDLPGRALDALHASERRRGLGKRVTVGVLAAAAAVALVLAPAVLHKSPTAPTAEELAAMTEAAWEAPDLDDLWEDAQLVDLDASALASSDDGTGGSDAALDAMDF